MAAATTIALASAAVIGGGAKAISGLNMMNTAKEEIDNYERQDLANPYEQLQKYTSGSRFASEENARLASTALSALRPGGLRALLGGLPTIMSQTNALNREQQINLDDQDLRRGYAIAGDNARIRDTRELREREDLSGLGTMMNTGRQDMWNGIGDITAGFSQGLGMTDFGGFTKQVSPVNEITPFGIQSFSPFG